jgi:hypothetical protein
MSADLVTWLRAQLDEDEPVARAASDEVVDWIADDAAEHGTEDEGGHIKRWRPARVLAEVEAKRRLLDVYEEAVAYYTRHTSAPAGEVTGLLTAVKLAALPYAGHPGYRTEWAP